LHFFVKNTFTRWFSLFKPKKATTNNCNWCFAKVLLLNVLIRAKQWQKMDLLKVKQKKQKYSKSPLG